MLEAILGLVLAVAFFTDAVLPLPVLIILYIAATIWTLATIKTSRLSALPRLMIIVYALPFTGVIGYLFNERHVWASTPRGIEIARDLDVVRIMMTLTIIGLLGLVAGAKLAARWPRPKAFPPETNPLVLRGPAFLFLLGLALLASWLGAPSQTIFEVSYAATLSTSVGTAVNLSSSHYISYILLILLYVDAERDLLTGSGSRWKLRAVLATTAFITVFFQVLRGDREITGLLIALVFLYLTGGIRAEQFLPNRMVQWRRLRRITIPLLITFIVFTGLGAARGQLANGRPDNSFAHFIAEGFSGNAWSPVSLTTLAIAAKYNDGSITYLNGQTYVDYLLSLPPGFISQAVGYTRPLENDRGPAWWSVGISIGGVQSAVVPFRNFGIFGVLLILALFGYFVGAVDRGNTALRLRSRLMFGAFGVASVGWFWYGDMYLVRAVMLAFIAEFAYRLLAVPRAVPASAPLFVGREASEPAH